MSTRPTTPSCGRRGGALQVAPAAVEFDAVEPGACFLAAFSVRNASSRPLRFRLVPPAHASPFKVLSRAGRDLARTANPTVQLPAGLAERFDIAFELPQDATNGNASSVDRPGGPAIFHDVLLVKGEDDSVVQVPLMAKRAGPRLEMTPAQLDFGFLVRDQRSAQYIELTNTGSRSGVFELEVLAGSNEIPAGVSESASTTDDPNNSGRLAASASANAALVLATPRRGWLGPKESVNIQIEAVGTTLGGFRALVRARVWESWRLSRSGDMSSPDGTGEADAEDILEGGEDRSVRHCAEKFVDVTGAVVEHTVELLLQRGFSPVTGLHFGSLFAGESKTIETVLRNNGPQPLHFKVSLSFGGGLGQSASQGASGEEDRAMFERKKELGVSPIEGRIEPFGTLPIAFSYRPRAVSFEALQVLEKRHQQHGGAPVTNQGDSIEGNAEPEGAAHRLLIPPEVLNAFASIQCADLQGQNLTFEVSGRKFLPRLSLLSPAETSTLPLVFDFGDVKTHDRADMIVTMKNVSGLPVHFSIPKLAHFTARPSDGRLDVLQSQNVVLSFTPTQLGSFRSTLKLLLGTSILTIPISVLGRAAAIGDIKTRPIIGGTNALPKDFVPQFKFLLPEEAKRTKGQLFKKFQRVSPYEAAALNGTAAIDEYEFEGTNNTHLTYCVKELNQRADHKASYHEYLAKCRLQRQQQQQLSKRKGQSSAVGLKASFARLREGGDDDIMHEYEDVNLGMDTQVGLEPKPLRMPSSLARARDPLWLREASAGGSLASPAKAIVDENKLIKKKFKAQPATQAELADCALTLEFDQLELITSGPKTINYGKISVNGIATKSLAVHNNLPQNVLVRLHLQEQDNMPELAVKTVLKSQVIPPRSIGGFDLAFSSTKEQFFQKELTYSINGVHTRQVTIVAEVAPIVVDISSDSLAFEFSLFDQNPSMLRDIVLTNTSDSVAPFEWLSQLVPLATSARPESSKSTRTTTGPSDKTTNGPPTSAGSPTIFSIIPPSGVLDPAAAMICKVAFTPPSNNSGASASFPNVHIVRSGECSVLTQTFQLNVVGGKTMAVICKAVIYDVKVVVKEKKIDFGTLSAGVERVRKLTLTNQTISGGGNDGESGRGSRSSAVFYASIDPPSLLSSIGLAVSPAVGSILDDEPTELAVSILAHRPVTLDSTAHVVVQIRGGKTFRIPVVADVIIPDVHVVPVGTIDFNDVIIGVSVPRVVTLENHSSIPASLVLDLSSSLSDEFSIATPANLLARLDDASSVFTPILCNSQTADGTGSSGSDERDSDALCCKWQINLPPSSTVAFHLVFTPKQPGDHNHHFPIQFAGINGSSGVVAQPGTIKRQVCARAIAPCLLFSSSVINFNRCVITREGIRKVPYTKQLVLTNHEAKTLKWQIDTSKLRLANQSAVGSPGAKRSVSASAKSLIFYVAPDKGELAPDEEVKVRVSFLPADPVEYLEEELPLLVDDEFYLNLTVRGEGIHPHLSFSESRVILPTVPLGFTARAKVLVQSTGYDHLELTYRVPLDTTKAPLTVHFPKGKVLSMACPTLPIEIRFGSPKSVAFNARVEFFDADGNVFYLPVAGCTENCLLTNYGFLQSRPIVHRSPIAQGLPSQPNNTSGDSASSAVAFYTHSTGRFPVYLLPNAQVDVELEKQLQQQQGHQSDGFVSVDTSLGQTEEATATSSLPKQALGASASSAAACPSPSFSEAEIDFMIQYINSNFVRTPVTKFPNDFADSDGKPLYEILEMVCTKKPGSTASSGLPRTNGPTGSANKSIGKASTSGDSSSAMQSKRDLVARITAQYTDLLKFLKSYGAMMHDVQAEHLLRQEYYVAACEDSRADSSLLSSPALASMSFVHRRSILEREWRAVSVNAWMKVLYQVIKCFLLYRITGKSYQQQMASQKQTQQQKPMQSGSLQAQPNDAPLPRAFEGSNIYSESEMVLVQWVCDRTRSLLGAIDPPPEMQLLDVARDLQDGRFLFHVLVAHIPTLSANQSKYHGFKIDKRHRPMSASRLQQNAQQLLSTLTLFGVDFGMRSDHFLANMNHREMVLLLLHFYQTLPQFIPKTTIEFRGSLGQVIEKSIELKNPGSRPLRYEVFVDDASTPPSDGAGSNAWQLASAFSIESTEVTLEPGKSVAFVVTCRPRFSRKVTARLVFQSVRERDSSSLTAPTGATMVFLLESNILARRPVRVIQIEANTFERKLEDIAIDNQFPVNASYKMSMIQSHRQAPHQVQPGVRNATDDGRSTDRVSGSRGAPGGEQASIVEAFRGRKKANNPQDKPANRKSSSIGLTHDTISGHDSGPIEPRKARTLPGKAKDDADYSWCMCAQRPFFLPEFGITGDDDREGRSETASDDNGGELQATTFGSSVLSIRSSATSKVKLEFLPLIPGNYKCQLLLLDEKVGEFMYEIHAVAHLPPSLETLEFQCEASSSSVGALGSSAVARFHFLRELTVPAKNPLLYRALASLVERASGQMKLKLKDGLKKCEETHHAHFHVEFNSPFFAAAQQELTLSINAQSGRQQSFGAGKAVGSDTALATGRTDKSNNDGSSSLNQGNQSVGKAPPLKGNQARLGTPRSNIASTNSVLIDFQPKGAGVYTSKLLLRSFNTCCGSSDIRVYDLVAKVKEPNVKTMLEFVAPARHSIVQEIPLSNPSDTPWTLRASFDKTENTKESMFSGPSTLQVPAKRSASYPLAFSPQWISAEKSNFVLVNPATQQQFEFELAGYGEEPLAQDHIVLTCQARTSIVHEFDVLSFKTDPPGEQTFKVESDLRDVVGASTVTAPPARRFTVISGGVGTAVVAKYPLMFTPIVSGTYFGSITFTNEATKEYIWYTIEANVSPPEPEATLEMRTAVRGAIGVEISLANPLDHSVTFTIELRGQGLLGPASFALDANASGVYELVYSPLLVTASCPDGSKQDEGAILFSADEIGQFWYRLLLVAEPASSQQIDDMQCVVGDVCSQPIWLQNPSDQELALQFRISNTRNFSIKGSDGGAKPARTHMPRPTAGASSLASRAIVLSPFAKTSVIVEYTPSSLSDYECASIVFFEPDVVSNWEFTVRGKGKPPSVMKAIDITAKVGEAASTLFMFKNPFAEAVGVEVKLVLREDGSCLSQLGDARKGSSVFDMLLKKNHVHLEAFSHLQVPISFLPRAVSEAHAEIIIRGSEAYRELEWHYPIHGVAEAPVHPRPVVLVCQARDSVEKKVSLELLAVPADMQLADEVFTTEWEIPSERFGALATSAGIERALSATPERVDGDQDGVQRADRATTTVTLPYTLRFEPLRPYRGSIYLLIKKKSGGRWRFEIVLDASDPPVDDTITIESSLNQTSSITFQLRNQFRQGTAFNAEFSAGSSAAFSVYPAEGVLPPYGSNEGQPFVVSFTPTGYGKMQSGQLVIVTEEMQWTFNVKGTYPDASSKSSSNSATLGSSLSSSASRTRLGITPSPTIGTKARQK